MSDKQCLVTVGQSARMLVKMATSAGFAPIAIDCFGDLDTRQLSLTSFQLNSLRGAELQPLLHDISTRQPITGLVYGSGFEQHPDSLLATTKYCRVLGNPPSLFERLLNKADFFSHLTSLDIAHPATCYSRPADPSNWLFKPNRSQGGMGIVAAGNADDASQRGYWQQRISGQSCSALFIADGRRAAILGFNRQWTYDAGPHAPLLFGGVHNQACLPVWQQKIVRRWLKQLLTIYPLQGLGSIDFIANEHGVYLLEINPRIPASAQLYGNQVFRLHLQASQTGLPHRLNLRHRPRGYQIVFAQRDLLIADRLNWPQWAMDLPADGTLIAQGQPICSIIAGGRNAAQVVQRLQQRQRIIEQQLKSGIV